MNRRDFLVGLFGTAAVVTAGPIPAALEAIPEAKFKEIFYRIKMTASAMPELWCNYATGDYSHRPLPGFVPIRGESERLATIAIQAIYKEFANAN